MAKKSQKHNFHNFDKYWNAFKIRTTHHIKVVQPILETSIESVYYLRKILMSPLLICPEFSHKWQKRANIANMWFLKILKLPYFMKYLSDLDIPPHFGCVHLSSTLFTRKCKWSIPEQLHRLAIICEKPKKWHFDFETGYGPK